MKTILVIINSIHVYNKAYINLLEKLSKVNIDVTWLHQKSLSINKGFIDWQRKIYNKGQGKGLLPEKSMATQLEQRSPG